MSQKQMTYIQEATILHIPKQYIKLKWEKNFIGFFINSLLTKGFFTDFSYIAYEGLQASYIQILAKL